MKADRSPLTIEYVPVGEVRPHPENARQGDVGAIHVSMETNGVYRPIIVQASTGFILAGNHTYKAMTQAGAVVVPVVRRDVDDDTARRIMLADNRTADLGDYDDTALLALLQEVEDLAGTGYDEDDLDALLNPFTPDTAEDPKRDLPSYTGKVDIPQYQIVGPCPPVAELVDTTKTATLTAHIDAADAPEDVKAFLRLAAHRHTVVNYRKVAEFYPHATPEVQALIEESALVIIDVDDAIRNGYTRLAATIDGYLAETEGDPEDDDEA